MPRTDLIQFRRGTAAAWTAANPTLAEGETGFETDTGQIKIGDGATAWATLAYTPGRVALTGDVTAAGTGSTAATIAADAVTYAKMQNVSAASRLLGRGSASGSGDTQELTVSGGLTISGTALTTTATGAADPRSSLYQPFTPSGVDDEFDDASFTGWTLVDDGTHQGVVTEANDVASVLLPGGDSSQHLHAWMKSTTVSTNDIIEMGFSGMGRDQNFNICGLVMADGTTYAAGSQVLWAISLAEGKVSSFSYTNYNNQVSSTGYSIHNWTPTGLILLRLKYEGSNNWRGYISADAISWVDVTGSFARTLTPTAVGFFATTYGGANPFNWSVRYFRKTT